MYCEGRYFCEFGGNKIFLGRRGQPTSYTKEELLSV